MSAPSHPAPALADAFAELTDPRVERTKRHQLLDVITITLCGVFCGAENWLEITQGVDVSSSCP